MKFLIPLILLCSASAWAADKTETPKEVSPDGEAVDVSKVTEKYWAQGKDTELGVVQNRKYTSEHRLELDIFTGTVSTDPFLSVHHFGGSLGYYFTQYTSLHAIAWKDSVSDSDARQQLSVKAPGVTVDLNRPKSFYGLQVNQNFLYGKASLFGKAIIYVDIFALAGAGVTDTDTGKNFTGFVGIGQKIHINQTIALNLDYRIMRFNELIPSSSTGGTNARSNTTDVVTAGLCFFY